MFENKCRCDDSDDAGLCDGDSDLKKDSNSNLQERRTHSASDGDRDLKKGSPPSCTRSLIICNFGDDGSKNIY